MSKHIFKGLATILIVTLLMLSIAVPALAFDARSDATVTVAGREVVDDDLYVAAETITIDGTINGDLWAAGSTITVNGIVNGSVMAVGKTVNINGDVDHAVRVAGDTINIISNINGDLIVAGNEVNVASTAKINGDLLFGVGTARIDGFIDGDVKGYGGEVTISNELK